MIARTIFTSAALAALVAAGRCSNSTGPSVGDLPCTALEAAGLGPRLLFPSDAGYEPQILSYFTGNARRRPYCIVLPQSTAEVSTALKALVNINNGAGDWHIAIKSGGHNGFGASSISEGVTIDLAMLNATTYDAATNIASLRPGARWKQAYADLQAKNVTVTGGRDGSVGVGGFLLGGGVSYFSARQGFGCDSIVRFEVVLANGTVVEADSNQNADLWMALRGGGSNFGIVTRIDMEAFPSKKMAHELRVIGPQYVNDIIEMVHAFTEENEGLADNALVPFVSYDAGRVPGGMHAICIHINTAGQANATSAFSRMRALPALANTSASVTMAELAAQPGIQGAGRHSASTALLFRNDLNIMRGAVALHTAMVEALKTSLGADKFQTVMFFQPMPTHIAQISKQRGGNVLGLDGVSGNAILFNAGVVVTGGEAAHPVARAELFKLTAGVKKLAASASGDLDFVYANYADASQDPLGSYGAANVALMKAAAAKYDQEGVFQRRVPGGFKISRVG